MKALSEKKMKEAVWVTCYGKKEKMTRKEAIDFYLEGMMNCDSGSSECERYTNIYCQLMEGFRQVSDEY